MTVPSSPKIVLTGPGGKAESLHRNTEPLNQSARVVTERPKLKRQLARPSSTLEVRTAKRIQILDTKHSSPVLRKRKIQHAHQRQQSMPHLSRHQQPQWSPQREAENEWLAGFDTLDGLEQGKISVRLDSEAQFKTFLNWVRGRPVHAITLNNSLAGFERDFQTLHSLGLTEASPKAPDPSYLKMLSDEYASSPGIADLFRALPELRFLDMSRCDPSEPDLLRLLQGLKECRFKLATLHADRLYWGDRSLVEALLNYLSGPTKLQTLSIRHAKGVKLTPQGLLKALRTNVGLREVSLSVVGNRGAVDPDDIALAIFLNPSLQKLSVSTTRFISSAERLLGDEDPVEFEVNDLVVYHFMSAFVKNATLETLSIRGAALPAAIIDAISDSVGEHSALREVHLDQSDENRAALQRLQSLLAKRQNTHGMEAAERHG